MAEIRTEPDDDGVTVALRAALGRDFADWVLASSEGRLSPTQREVATALLQLCARSGIDDNSAVPRGFLLSGIRRLDEQLDMSPLNQLRAYCGGAVPSTPSPTGDATLDALIVLAIDGYGELLLTDDYPNSALLSPYSSQAGKAAIVAFARDSRLPFLEGDDEGESISLYRSTGSGGGFQLVSAAPSIVGAAFDAVRLRGARPSLDALIQELPNTLEAARRAWTGKDTTTLGVASLTGVLLPPDNEIRFAWGRLRPARPEDHPRWVQQSLGDRRTTMRRDDGTEIVISDAGDVILEAEVPYAVEERAEFDIAEGWPNLSSREGLEARIMQVRLAYLLASAETRPPVLLPVWRRFVEPLAQGGGMGWSNPEHFATRTPTQLDDDQRANWVRWIEVLDSVPVRRLGPAPERVLRASAERRDGADALIDAVIAWEALFGADTEATFRVSGAMAKLLRTATDDRRNLRKRAAEIYRLRSKLVHGVEVRPRGVMEASNEALQLAVDALRELLSNRTELVPQTSADRSTELLLE